MDTKDKSPIETFLEERESVGEHLIKTRLWAMDRAEERFKKEYEDILEYNKIYEASELHPETGEVLCWSLREEYGDIFWGMVDEFEEELLEYKNEEYDT